MAAGAALKSHGSTCEDSTLQKVAKLFHHEARHGLVLLSPPREERFHVLAYHAMQRRLLRHAIARWGALRLGRPLFLLRSLVDSGPAWPREMLDHGAFVLNDMADLLGMPTSGDLHEAVAF